NLGPEYLTYVLWAITPDGRPSNLGEIVPKGGKSSIQVSTDLPAFVLLVTAEPYFAVARPSNLIVLKNLPKRNTKGWQVPVDSKFEAIERGQYTVDVNAAQLPATVASDKVPCDLQQARNAAAIARAQGRGALRCGYLSKGNRLSESRGGLSAAEAGRKSDRN